MPDPSRENPPPPGACRNPERLRSLLEHQPAAASQRLGDVLLAGGRITRTQLDEAISIQREKPKVRIGEILIALGYIALDDIQNALFYRLGIPFVDLRSFEVDPYAVSLLPVGLALRHSAYPLCLHGRKLVLAVEDPLDTGKLEIIRFAIQRPVEPVRARKDDIHWAIERYYPKADHPCHGCTRLKRYLDATAGEQDSDADPNCRSG